jgi:uncharacterized protein YndB with AHSA1/START domain
MTARSALHTSFTLERDFAASPMSVFEAWADPEVKRRWSDCHPEHTAAYSLDFRPLGHEHHRVVYPTGAIQVIDKVFFDIVPGERILFAYDIVLDARRLSVSMVTVEFKPGPAGARMTLHEQLAYLDGHEDLAERIRGTEEGLDRLVLELANPATTQ